jgi:hypothetical protein
MIIMTELGNLLNNGSGSAESIEDLFDTSSFLHRDNSELIFFINPNEERFSIIMEDTSTRWPVSVQVASFEESVSFPI